MKIDKNIGYFEPGKGSCAYDKNLFIDLVDLNFEEMLYFLLNKKDNIKKEKMKILMELVKTSGFTDPRLWPNRIAGYCGQNRTTVNSSLIASISSIDSKLYGSQPIIRAYRLLKEIKETVNINKKEEIIDYIEKKYKGKMNLPGFNRIINQFDDRVPYMINFIKKEKKEKYNEYIKITKVIQDYMHDEYKLEMNIAFLASAIFLMSEIEEEQIITIYLSISFLMNTIPSYINGFKSKEEFIKIEKDDIVYIGEDEKKWN